MSQDQSDQDRFPCRVCDEPIYSGEEWIALNRYLFAKGGECAASEAQRDDGEYAWDVDPSSADQWDYTAVALHWPVCAGMWIEGRMAELPTLPLVGGESE